MANTKAAPAVEKWRSRIVGEAEVLASELVPNDRNWRLHPKSQQEALAGVLDEVGFVQRIIVNRRSGKIVDGHARAELAAARGEKIPVVYVDLSEHEEALVLATLDPIGAMAETNAEMLGQLIQELPVISSEQLLATIPAPMIGFDDAPETVAKNIVELNGIKQSRKAANAKTAVKNDTERYLVIVFSTRTEREAACERLGLSKDERYVAAMAVNITGRMAMNSASKHKAASVKHSGAGG